MMKEKRWISLLLALVLFLSLLPAGASAQARSAFILVVEAGGSLVIAPEYISYSENQTVRQALAESGHSFVGLDIGMVSQIDGAVGNFTRSDEFGSHSLDTPASEIGFYRFSEETDSRPSEGLMQLMTAMADYACKADDVRAAAKAEYDTAYAQFSGIDSASAALLAEELNRAVQTYEDGQNGPHYAVTFLDGGASCDGMTVTAENPYGKVWTDDDGVLELPAGSYRFCVTDGDVRAEGEMTVDGAETLRLALPRQDWLDTAALRLSGSYGSEDSEENKFSDGELSVGEWADRTVTVPVFDTFTGTVYTFAEYTDELTVLPTLTAIYTPSGSGEERSVQIPFASLTSGAGEVLQRGAEGNTVCFRISAELDDGFTYAQDYTVHFVRIPTLTELTITDQNGVGQASTMPFDGETGSYTYKVLDTVTSVSIDAQPLDDRYKVLINGGAATEVDVTGETVIDMTVLAENRENSYQLTILPGEGLALSFVTDSADVTVEVVNRNGQVMPCEKFREGTDQNRYQYTLVPGEDYSYIATAKEFYHTADAFTMEDAADSTIHVSVPTEDWLDALALGFGGQAARYKDTLKLDSAFDTADHSYTAVLADTEHIPYLWAEAQEVTIEALYRQIFASSLYHGVEKRVELTSGKTTGEKLTRILMDENPIENTLTLRLSKEIDGILCYQDYVIALRRSLSLESLSAACDGLGLVLEQEDGTAGFDPEVTEYSVTVSMAARELTLDCTTPSGNTCYGEEALGYRVEGPQTIALDGTIDTQYAVQTVANDKAPEGSTSYTISILKSLPVNASFATEPGDSLLAMYETRSGQRLWPDEYGEYSLCEGYSYRYVLTRTGYVSRSGILTVTRDENESLVVTDGGNTYPVAEDAAGGGVLALSWTLEKAPRNESIADDLASPWPNFRGSESNNGVTDAPIPTAAEAGTLYWANQIGVGIDADAVGSPILVDGDLITYASDTLYRIDTVTGQVKQTGQMDHKSSFSITPPAYADGMVFVALSGGTVQAFNAETLESLWLYTDPLGGQPNCPLTIRDGYLYTGFWNSETGDANFVCLPIADEDPTQDKEPKLESWYHTRKGGYYWAGAYVTGDYVLVGTDDGSNGGTAQTSQLLLFDRRTGRILDRCEGLNGDIRSTVVYDEQTDAYYFTSKGGSFYSVRLEDGRLSDLWSIALTNGSSSPAMSTSSPVVYNGRAYVGVSGAGQFAAYSGHSIHVLDLTQKSIAYTVQTQGYPQTSGLLTTAYEEDRGYVYVYFFDNMTPGKLRVLRDSAGQTAADYLTTEGSHDTAYALFTPTGDHAQYAICSPITDAYGTIYYKNDSAYLMAFGSAIEKLEVTKNPDKMFYTEGETFDPAGMVVTATYANGKTRDVTDYVTITADPVTAGTNTVTISFPHVLYHNAENGTAMTSGVATTTPVTTLTVHLGAQQGDVDGDGLVTKDDAKLIADHYNEFCELNAEQLAAADVNADGTVDIRDANLICGWVNQERS